MTAITDDAHNASFSQASVSVTVPFGPDASDVGVLYRAFVTMIWHRPNESVQGTARHRVNFYRSVLSNGDSGEQENVCGGYYSPDW